MPQIQRPAAPAAGKRGKIMGRKNKLAAPPPPRKARAVVDPPEAPAKITPDLVKDRGYRGNDGKPSNNKAWRRLSPLQAAMAKNQLSGGEFSAADRFRAGQRYSEIFDTSERSGKDSTQALNVSRGGKLGGGSGQAASEAWDERLFIERLMGARDRTIIRLVCGEGGQPAAAVKQACGDGYKFTAQARFREALDALVEAFDALRGKRSSVKKVA
jgi:hypothetical protein